MTHEEHETPMPLQKAIKEHRCPRCGGTARLIVDLDSGYPLHDDLGRRQYFCIQCDFPFSVDHTRPPRR